MNDAIMPKKLFSEFSALLKQQRRQLVAQVREKIAASGEGAGFAGQSKLSDADALEDETAELDLSMLIRESQELQDVEAALARISDGSYGSCTDCGEEIGRARLKAYPTAKRCLPCQEKKEQLSGRAR